MWGTNVNPSIWEISIIWIEVTFKVAQLVKLSILLSANGVSWCKWVFFNCQLTSHKKIMNKFFLGERGLKLANFMHVNIAVVCRLFIKAARIKHFSPFQPLLTNWIILNSMSFTLSYIYIPTLVLACEWLGGIWTVQARTKLLWNLNGFSCCFYFDRVVITPSRVICTLFYFTIPCSSYMDSKIRTGACVCLSV